jgi:hypothetical protein
MINKSILCSLIFIVSLPCLAEIITYCEDGKPYTENRKNDPTCHSISNKFESNGRIEKPIAIDSGVTAGGGGCGSSSHCIENHDIAPSTDSSGSQPTLQPRSPGSGRTGSSPYGPPSLLR